MKFNIIIWYKVWLCRTMKNQNMKVLSCFVFKLSALKKWKLLEKCKFNLSLRSKMNERGHFDFVKSINFEKNMSLSF